MPLLYVFYFCESVILILELVLRFVELGSILDPGKPPKMDKSAILSDAVHMVTQLRTDVQKLKDSNEKLHEKIKELKVSIPVYVVSLVLNLLKFCFEDNKF